MSTSFGVDTNTLFGLPGGDGVAGRLQMFADFHFTRVFSIDGGYPALETAFAATEA